MADLHEHRHVQSLDAYMKQGLELEDHQKSMFEGLVQELENEKLMEAIKKLEPQQQWLVEKIYFEGRTQVELAQELGIDKTSLAKRKERILKKLKKFLS